MKLYTEEQAKYFFECGRNYQNNAEITFRVAKDEIPTPPIELPSDEEIENDAKEFVKSHDFSLLTNPNHLANRCFQEGAKWVIEQIKNKYL